MRTFAPQLLDLSLLVALPLAFLSRGSRPAWPWSGSS